MPKIKVCRLIGTIVLCGILAQGAAAQNCTPPTISTNAKIYNIFSPDQEMILGELSYQQAAGEWRLINDPHLVSYINSIGENLTKHLPPTGLKFQFFIIDIPEANGFNVPGGYVFITRKLIALANSEDDLAGVLAHELGHAVAHHSAADFSTYFKKILNVTQVGDRKDIIEKYNLLIERERTKQVSQNSDREENGEIEADRIGLFAFAAAGYDPAAFASFTERLEDLKPDAGNWFTDIFGRQGSEQKILRAEIRAIEKLPAECREGRRANASSEFLKWQADVVSYRQKAGSEDLPGLLWRRELSPKLRSDIAYFAFSPDGNHIIAQDDFAITVIKREPLEVVFQIPATEVQAASFTPDGQFVVFGTENLRYEKWSVAEKRPVEIRELSVRNNCLEHGFSPDGKYLACVDEAFSLNVLDTQSGKKIWEKKDFHTMSFAEYLTWRWGEERMRSLRLFNIEFSPDSRFLMVARSAQGRFTFRVDAMIEDETEDSLVALDLKTLKPLNAGGNLKKMTRGPFLFLDANRILAMAKAEDSGVFSFPDGKRLDKLPVSANEIERTANPNYVILKPLKNAKLGVFDLTRKAFVSGLNKTDVALWNNLIVYEAVSGQVLLAEVTYDETQKNLQARTLGTLEVPASAIGDLRATEVSDNFEWLAISSQTRGAVWNTRSGERKMYVRGFRGVVLADNGDGIGDFPKYETQSHGLAILRSAQNGSQALREIPEKGARQYRRFLLVRKSLKDSPGKEKPDTIQRDSELAAEASLSKEVRFELFDLIDNKRVWFEEYPKEAPRYFFDEYAGRLILYWTANSYGGKSRLKDPALAARAKQLRNKDDDYVMEIIDAFSGKAIGTLLLETGKGSFDILAGTSQGDWLALHDSNNRILVYSISASDLRHRFFGASAAINPAKNQIAVENYPGELSLYDLKSGDSQGRLNFAAGTAFLRFSLDGKKLFVLTSEQKAYAFDSAKVTMKTAVPSP